MGVASSLSNRIFLACTLLATLSLGFAFSFVNARATSEAEGELRRELTEAAALVDERRTALTSTYTTMARLVADLPKLKAAVATEDPPTVQPLADDYLRQIDADLLVVSNRRGDVLAAAGTDSKSLLSTTTVPGREDDDALFITHPRGLLEVVSVPIVLVTDQTEMLGRLTVGFFLDAGRAAEFKALTASELAFAANGRVVASSLPATAWERLTPAVAAREITTLTIGEEEYLALARPMHAAVAASERPTAVMVILRSRTERLRFLTTVRNGLAGALILTVVLATILSYGVARTMTRPLTAITRAMRDVAATGDLTRKVVLHSRAWDDEDARLLASSFNTLTESIGRFQREAAQRERLSSLGRLSTVVAHEIRNPLMIIRATLASLRRDRVTAAEIREAVADIDEETIRLNRLVSDVLDFARPIRFELAAADLNEICRASVAAAWAGDSQPAVHLQLDADVPPIMTDTERLRTALVNIFSNARHAVLAQSDAVAPGEGAAATTVHGEPRRAPVPEAARTATLPDVGVIVRTRSDGSRVTITIADRGVGIAPDEMTHIFDPYFTTRRTGTGLGLPIAKNIIEGLGGTIAVQSRVGEGTDIRIEFPIHSAEPTA